MYAEIVREYLLELSSILGMSFVSGAIVFTVVSLIKAYLTRNRTTL